jgi:hypothetical protein
MEVLASFIFPHFGQATKFIFSSPVMTEYAVHQLLSQFSSIYYHQIRVKPPNGSRLSLSSRECTSSGLYFELVRLRSEGRLAGCAPIGSVYNKRHRRRYAPYLMAEGQSPPRVNIAGVGSHRGLGGFMKANCLQRYTD